MRDEGRIIEYRCYHTVMGDWYYFTADDGQIDDSHDYVITMVLEGYESLRDYFGSDRVVDDTLRRLRKKLPDLSIHTLYGFGYRLG